MNEKKNKKVNAKNNSKPTIRTHVKTINNENIKSNQSSIILTIQMQNTALDLIDANKISFLS